MTLLMLCNSDVITRVFITVLKPHAVVLAIHGLELCTHAPNLLIQKRDSYSLWVQKVADYDRSLLIDSVEIWKGEVIWGADLQISISRQILLFEIY